MKSTITFFFLLSVSINLFGQTAVKGFVSDDLGALSGVNIIIKNTRIGVVSDLDGNYEIEAKKTDTLSISYLGYETIDILVRNKKNIKTVLSGNIALDAVEVIAYCTVKRTHTISCGWYTVCETECTSVESKRINKNFKSNMISEFLYPNPSKNGRFNLNLLKPYKNVEIQISNMSGQTVKNIS